MKMGVHKSISMAVLYVKARNYKRPKYFQRELMAWPYNKMLQSYKMTLLHHRKTNFMSKKKKGKFEEPNITIPDAELCKAI